MTHLVDLTKKPFNLNQEAIEWIEKTINEMTLDEKIGQLFSIWELVVQKNI